MNGIEQVANAVLYEGFLLYPYRLSSVKNRQRWNFGVLFPEPFCRSHGERSTASAECLVQAANTATVEVKIRFLQLIDGSAVKRDFCVGGLELDALIRSAGDSAFTSGDVPGSLIVQAVPITESLFRLGIRTANLAHYTGENRDEALGLSFIATHFILTVNEGRFISLIDPPEDARGAVRSCTNVGWWPVLATREGRQMLVAPMILYDCPQIAPQSPGDLFDSTEIDEILTLRIQTLTDAEKNEMRAADPRARKLLERSEALSREELFNLHASMRVDSPVLFHPGDRVRMRPRRRSDIFDIALAGKLATVVSVERDFEEQIHVCVTVDDDPGRELGAAGQPGHRFFFGMEELEPA